MRYTIKRAYEWSKDIAYNAGLIASDGCLLSDNRHINFTSVDLEQMNNFCLTIGRNLKIFKNIDSRGHHTYRIQFSDVAYYDFLNDIGIQPRKSKTIGNLKIPDQYYPDFLRGVFDGDGTVYGYTDKRWPGSYMYYISFASASRDFLDYMYKNNSKIIGTSGGSIRKSGHVFLLSYAKNDTKSIHASIYKDENAIFLSRKKIKLESFIHR